MSELDTPAPDRSPAGGSARVIDPITVALCPWLAAGESWPPCIREPEAGQ